jgi:predicted esterase
MAWFKKQTNFIHQFCLKEEWYKMLKPSNLLLQLFALSLIVLLVACGSPSLSSVPTATFTPEPPTATPSPEPPTNTPTPEPTNTSTPTHTPAPTKTQKSTKTNQVIYHEPSTSIKYSYFHYIPALALQRNPVRIVLSGHGNPRASYSELEKDVQNLIEHSLRPFADEYGYVILIMVIPGEAQYFHRSNVFEVESDLDPFYIRPDLEYVKVIDEFLGFLRNEGYTPHEKVFMTGFSNGGLQTNRFSILHPEKVMAVAIGSAGLYTYPMNSYEDSIMDYPIGVADVSQLNHSTYSLEAFKAIPHYFFVGENDTNNQNDPIGDIENSDDRAFYLANFGINQKERVPKYSQHLQSIGMQSTYDIFEGYGHEYTSEMLLSTFTFFESISIND